MINVINRSAVRSQDLPPVKDQRQYSDAVNPATILCWQQDDSTLLDGLHQAGL
jgi:hypothetical protein